MYRLPELDICRSVSALSKWSRVPVGGRAKGEERQRGGEENDPTRGDGESEEERSRYVDWCLCRLVLDHSVAKHIALHRKTFNFFKFSPT